MKRIAATILCAAAGLSSPAVIAMYLNPHGAGQALVYPYYTVNGGYATFFTITNTTDQGKALKVRVLEGYNGRDAQDLNLYLSPNDYWVAALVDAGNGGAAIFSNDNSCTVPKLPATSAAALALTTANFDGTGTQGKDGGPTDAARTREGHIEVIEMGTVTGPSATLSAISHVNGVPADCPSVVGAWAGGGQWIVDPAKDIGPPSGGLIGNAMILNVANGTVLSYGAEAIAQFYAQGGNGEHSRPDALTPNLSSGSSSIASVYTDDGALTLNYTRSIDAVSALFMADAIRNEYWTAKTIAAASEWVVTYPTKRFYVDVTLTPPQSIPRPLFQRYFDATKGGTSMSTVWVKFHDREEHSASTDDRCGFLCPGRNPDPNLSYETQVVTFNQNPDISVGPRTVVPSPPSYVLASQLVPMNIVTSSGTDIGGGDIFQATVGWAELHLGQAGSAATPYTLESETNGNRLVGQPVTGFWVNQLINGNVGGALANYTALYPHKSHVSCIRTDGTPCS